MASHDAPPRAQVTRRFDIDWLRVLAILTIFVFHCSRFFNAGESWHVKNNQLTPAFDVIFPAIGMWMMPLFFVLSGMSTYYALRSRNAAGFLRSRFLRLAVPLMTAGWFLLSPPQVYIERVTATGYNTPPFSGSFLEYLPHYFEGIYGLGGNFALTGLHLWYILWLFLFSLITLPLLLYLASGAGRRLVAALAAVPGGIFLFAVPMLFLELVLEPQSLGLGMKEGGWYLLTYILLLVYGFLLVLDPRFEEATQRHRGVALVLGILATALTLWGESFGGPQIPGLAGEIVGDFVWTFGCWCWLIAILGFGRTYLSFGNSLLKYAAEAVLAFYMLHQTVIVIVGFFIRDWQMSIALKYVFLATVSFAVIMILYEFLVRRVNVLRIMFGMKAIPKARPAPAVVS